MSVPLDEPSLVFVVLVVAGISPVRAGLGQDVPLLARAIPDRTLLAVAPRSGPPDGMGTPGSR